MVSYVFQEPGASLNPVFRIGNQIKESLKLHQPEKLRPLAPALSPFGGEREKNPQSYDGPPSPRPSGEKVAEGRMRRFDLQRLFGLFKKTSDAEVITRMGGSELRARRRKFQMIFQDPYGRSTRA